MNGSSMNERLTEKAKRVMFFARYEARQFGSPYIETEHLLLGLLREDKALITHFLRSYASRQSIRTQIEGHSTIKERDSMPGDLPLSNECKGVLAYAAAEAERLSGRQIGTEHLLLGLLSEEKSFAAEILHERGLRLRDVRKELTRRRQEKQRFERDATQRNLSSDFTLTFADDLTPDQIRSALHALADYYRACGGVGLEMDFELEEVLVGEPVSV